MTFMKNVANSFSFLNLTFLGGEGGGEAFTNFPESFIEKY